MENKVVMISSTWKKRSKECKVVSIYTITTLYDRPRQRGRSVLLLSSTKNVGRKGIKLIFLNSTSN